MLPGLWPGRPRCEGVGRASAESFAPLQTRLSWRKEARLAPKAPESVAIGAALPEWLPFRPDTRTPGGEAASHSRTLTLSTPGAGGRRDGTSLPARGLGPKGRDGFPRAVSGPSRRTPPPRGPLTRTPGRAPSARPGALGSSQVALGTERKATKQKKQQREGEGGAGARVLWTRLERVGEH